ncbi:MAG: nitrile hydratase accessory protein [Pseudomonadota bacterium]
MFPPDDPLAPPCDHFAEPWQANILAMATAMVRAGRFSQSQWATALGRSLRDAEQSGAPDTNETYFICALQALEFLCTECGVSEDARAERKSSWEEAYRHTPHGQPVDLKSGTGG